MSAPARPRLWFSAALALLFLLLAAAGCSHKDVPVISDREEIQRYVDESLDARELFRTTGFINGDTFTLPNDPAVYFDSVISVQRTETFLVLDTTVLKRYKSPNLSVYDAEIEVSDRFFIRRFRILGPDTTTSDSVRDVVRYGHFLKLGSDLQPYAGWKLFGFNGGIPDYPLSMTVYGPRNATIVVGGSLYDRFLYADIDPQTGEFGPYVHETALAYIRVDQIPLFEGGGDIDVACSSVSSQSLYLLLGGQARSGAVTERMNRPATDTYEYTLSSQFSPPYLWNLLVFQQYSATTPKYEVWCVPYRVP